MTQHLPNVRLRLCLIAFAVISLAGCCRPAKPLPPIVQTVEVEKPLPQQARDACEVLPDNGSRGGYRKQLEAALARCKAEIEARLDSNQ